MVRDHVAQCTSLLVVTSPTFYAQCFSGRYFHIVDIVPVPDGFKHRVPKTKYEYVLNSVFPEVVVDSIDLFLGEHFSNLVVESFGGLKIPSKGFLNYNPGPAF